MCTEFLSVHVCTVCDRVRCVCYKFVSCVCYVYMCVLYVHECTVCAMCAVCVVCDIWVCTMQQIQAVNDVN